MYFQMVRQNHLPSSQPAFERADRPRLDGIGSVQACNLVDDRNALIAHLKDEDRRLAAESTHDLKEQIDAALMTKLDGRTGLAHRYRYGLAPIKCGRPVSNPPIAVELAVTDAFEAGLTGSVVSDRRRPEDAQPSVFLSDAVAVFPGNCSG